MFLQDQNDRMIQENIIPQKYAENCPYRSCNNYLNPEQSSYTHQLESCFWLQQNSKKGSFYGLVNPYYDRVPDPIFFDQKDKFTDRYIPSRKSIQKGTTMNQEIEQKAKMRIKNIDQAELVSDLYKKVLLTRESQQEKKIQTFENKNKLQFKQFRQNQQAIIKNRIDCKSNILSFTKQIQKFVTVKRKIQKIPFKILDAPTLQDDYYLNLIDWSEKNVLSVGLSSCVYLWNSTNSKVSKLCEQDPCETITSVSWSKDGNQLAVGSTNGQVQIWDPVKSMKIRGFSGHHARVGAVAWNSNIFSSGSRDKNILNRDLRTPYEFVSKFVNHRQQVCGLKWSFDGQQLCSGGNDNRLLVWSLSSSNPICKFQDHKAAVKAVAWSPHQHGLLVSGGGTADRTIKFRDTLTETTLNSLQVGSQVCNLIFSKTLNELVSTHGYSLNEINVWKCPTMEKITTLTGHSMRVLYLAMNPDGNTIVTGAGDQTLRFWNIFPSLKQQIPAQTSHIQLGATMLR